MSDALESSDEQLARAAQGGDAVAYEGLVRRYLRPSMALAWQYARSPEDAEDIVQEAFHRMVRALPDYDHGRPFAAWLYTIVRNAARSAVGKDRRRLALAPLVLLDGDPPAPAAADPALANDVGRALDALAPMQQACVRLCDGEGFTSVEAARMLGIGEGTVRTHLHRARRQLREALAPDRALRR